MPTTLSWHLIPDGISTIVEFELKGEFTVPSIDAASNAQKVMVPLIARLTEQSEAEVVTAIQQSEIEALFLADIPDRPEEQGA